MEEENKNNKPAQNDGSSKYITLNGQKVTKRNMWSKQTQELINGVTLSLNVCFGNHQVPIKKNIYFTGDDTVMYIGGRHIVEYDIIRKKQTFVTKHIDDEAATSLNFYRTKKGVLKIAVALRSSSQTLPQVRVYNTSKNSTYSLVHSQLSSSSIITNQVFGLKGKYLLTAYEISSKKHQWGISLWLVEKERLCGSAEISSEITHLSVNPRAPSHFSVSGPGYFGIWEYDIVEKVFEEKQEINQNLSYVAKEDIVGHCWVRDSAILVVVVYPNILYIYDHYELIGIYMYEIIDNLSDKHEKNLEVEARLVNVNEADRDQLKNSLTAEHHKFGISTIESTARGFVVGVRNVGMISIFELGINFHFECSRPNCALRLNIEKDTQKPTHLGSFRLKEENVIRIHSISTSLDDMYLAIAVLSGLRASFAATEISNSQLASKLDSEKFEFNKIDLYIFNKAVVDAVKTMHKDPFEPLFEKGVHTGSICSINMCPSKTMIASLGEDHNVKFWEFGHENRGLHSAYYHETPNCIALHPHSFQLAIGFRDAIRFYYFIEEDLRLVHIYSQNSKSCTVLRYSEMGNYLAAGCGNLVFVFDALVYRVLTTLNAHAGTLRDLQWLNGDKLLLTSCTNGTTICWNTTWNEVREIENAQRFSKISAITYDHQYDIVVTCCEDARVRFYNEKGSLLYFEYISAPVVYTSVLISHQLQVIFFGTSSGSVRVYLWPFTELNKDNIEYIEFPVHQSPVTCLQLSHDRSFVISAAKDGSIYMLKIRHFADGADVTVTTYDLVAGFQPGQKKDSVGKIVNTFLLNSLALVGRANMDSKREYIKELEFKIQNAKTDVEDEKEKLVSHYNAKIKALEEKNRDALYKHKEMLAQAMEEADHRQKKILVEIDDQREIFRNEMIKLEDNHNEALLSIIKRSNELKAEIRRVTEYCQEEYRKFEDESAVNLREVENELHMKYQTLAENFHKMVSNMKTDQDKFKEALKQSEDDFDQYREQHKYKLEKELIDKRKESEMLRAQNNFLRKDNTSLHEKAIHHQSVIVQINTDIDQLQKKKEAADKHLENMHKRFVDKESLINMKEQQLKKLRDKNEHLQNFKQVFDHRVQTLKDEHEPLSDHLGKMEKHIKTIYKELIDEATANRKLEEIIDTREETSKSLNNIMKEKRELLRVYRRGLELYEHDLLGMLERKEYEAWPEQLTEIEHKFTKRLKAIDKMLYSRPELIENTIFSKQKNKIQEEDPETAAQSIKEELIRQRDFMNKKLMALKDTNNRGENDRSELLIRIQNENTNLINECNYLRQEKHILSNKIGMLEKEASDLAKDVSGSFLEEFRFRSKSQNAQESSPRMTHKVHIEKIPVGGSPFVKYKEANKPRIVAQPIPQPVKKTRPNEILFSLLKEINTYNDQQVRQKLAQGTIRDADIRGTQGVRTKMSHENTPRDITPLPQRSDSSLKIPIKRDMSAPRLRSTQGSIQYNRNSDLTLTQRRSNPNLLSGASVNTSMNLPDPLSSQRERLSNL